MTRTDEQIAQGMRQGCHACMEISATGRENANGISHTCVTPKRTEIETPEAMAERMFVRALGSGMKDVTGHDEGLRAIRARDEQIAAWCDEMEAEAKREAATHGVQTGNHFTHGLALSAKLERVVRCEGQASAFEAVAAMLRGAK